ncbi:MAG: phosphoribosylanthranilate isomerase [Tannerella sp.]|jgi:phosphoribosylanthranilate isomerase|nr:phosphoribosylanthranilate isomerase [Tannerella sp.]
MKIKVCGLRNPENIRLIEALDIDCAGFIFYRKSPRCVSDGEECREAIRRCTKPKVGVFVNETPENMLRKAGLYRLDGLQLHGDESPETCNALRQAGYFILKAFPVASAGEFPETRNYAGCTDYVLFDTKCAACGGSGLRFDWSLLERYTGRTPFFLSGGLAPDSIHDIRSLQHVRFAGIDLNSGFEQSPAVKDVRKLERFIREIRLII